MASTERQSAGENVIDTVFFDRDGVINEVVIREGVVSSPRSYAEFQLLDEFAQFYAALQPFNLRKFVVSNQPDVNRSLLLQEELDRMTSELSSRFQFDEIVYCTHDDIDECLCRKPKPGMLEQLVRKYGLQRERCIFIGDSKKDVLSGQAAGIRTIYLRRGYNLKLACQPEFIVDNLREVLSIIRFAEG